MNKEDIRYFRLLGIHVIIGFLVYFVPPLRNPMYLFGIIYFFIRIILAHPSHKTLEVLRACCYIVGAEVLFRMTNGGLFYEASKYLVILFVLFGTFYNGIKGGAYPYFIYLILLVPAVVLASINLDYDIRFRSSVAFVLSGPVCLGIAALYFYDKKISVKDLMDVLLYMALPVVSLTVYLFLYTPSIRDVLSGTESNFATSGGFGPNQTSSILGLGMVVFTARLFLRSPNLMLKVVNGLILATISFRAIVTFSRGGVFAAILVIGAFMVMMYSKANYRQQQQLIGTFALFCLLGIATWVVSSSQTEGLIDLRYANKEASGRESSDISTGRVELFVEEFNGFLEHPFFGVGASGMKQERLEELGTIVASHNEISRLFSEHGILGVIIFVILIFKPLIYRSQNRNNMFFYAFLVFWFATINHSAMRIAAPGLIYAMALLNVTNEKKRPIHRELPEAAQ
ncbi:MAG: O-antigen ligase family protein [Flavobacteriaceae bacterium]